MPTENVKAPLFTRHKGVSIYYVFKDDDASAGNLREFWFVLDPWKGEDAAFDVRDLAAWNDALESVKATLWRAIDSGELKAPEEE